MLTVLVIIGTRPEAIKMGSVIHELKKFPQQIETVVCVTAQHRKILDQVLTLFEIKPDYDLDLMIPNQTLTQITANILQALNPIMETVKPDWVLVQGDTTTAMTAALAATYHKIKVAHVEAGLRSGDIHQPFPEEINRRLIDGLSSLHFAPTFSAQQNLHKEGYNQETIYVVGNTGIDMLLRVVKRPYNWAEGPLHLVPTGKMLILVTIHRRESWGESLTNLCKALVLLSEAYRDQCHFVLPVHPNPNVKSVIAEQLSNIPNITLLEPLDYLSFVHLLQTCALVLTDSGGVQEEAAALNIPALVLREITDRPESVAIGLAQVVGTQIETIRHEFQAALEKCLSGVSSKDHSNMVYGDGRASERITAVLLGNNAGMDL